MKFKTYKAAKNYLVDRVEKIGIDVRDINIDMLMCDLFKGSGVGADFELELHSPSDTFPATVRALRVPRRGTVCDKCWEATMRRLGDYMGMYYMAGDADGLARDIKQQAMFAQHMVKEAL